MNKKNLKKDRRYRLIIFVLALIAGGLWLWKGWVADQNFLRSADRLYIFKFFGGLGLVLATYGAIGMFKWLRKEDEEKYIFVGNEKLQLGIMIMLVILGISLNW